MAKTQEEKGKGTEAGGKKGKEAKQQKPSSGMRSVLAIAIPLLILFALFFFLILPSLSVPFSTFKKNFAGAERIAIVATIPSSGSGATLQCAAQVVQVAAHSRNATTIDYYVINQTACLASVGGLGHVFTPVSDTIGNCINSTKGETSLFLNYSTANSTLVTPYKFYVYGDLGYMTRCPIAVDLS